MISDGSAHSASSIAFVMSNSTRQDAQASTAGSSTVTVTPATAETGAGPSQPPRNTVGVLKLRGGPSRRQRVVWSDETVDNEGMGKKKSKSTSQSCDADASLLHIPQTKGF